LSATDIISLCIVVVAALVAVAIYVRGRFL